MTFVGKAVHTFVAGTMAIATSKQDDGARLNERMQPGMVSMNALRGAQHELFLKRDLLARAQTDGRVLIQQARAIFRTLAAVPPPLSKRHARMRPGTKKATRRWLSYAYGFVPRCQMSISKLGILESGSE